MKFIEWLENELQSRGWRSTDLAKRSGISDAAISRIINNGRKPTTETLAAFARALKLPPETVYRAAGLLPPATKQEELIDEINYLISGLPPEEQENAREYIRMRRRLVEERKAKAKLNGARNQKPRTAGS